MATDNSYEAVTRPGLVERFFSGVWLAALVNILGVAAGYLGSHFDKQIEDAWSGLWDGQSKWSGGAIDFALVSLAFGLLFCGLSWAQKRGSDRFALQMSRSSESIEKNTNDLKGLSTSIEDKTQKLAERAQIIDDRVRQLYTLPPQGFLVKYAKAILGIVNVFSATRVEASLAPNLAEEGIRTQLLFAMNLARGFDTHGTAATYGCNVMLFRESGSLSDSDMDSLQRRLRFIERGVDIRQLAGVLETVRELSVSSTKDGPDLELPALVLPIPRFSADELEKDLVGVLPGAAEAFVGRTEAIIETPANWLKLTDTAAFSDYVKRDMERYADEEMAKIQSFLSIPLYPPLRSAKTVDEDDAPPFAILNIHRSTPTLISAERLELFAPLISLSALVIAAEVWRYLGRSTAILDANEEGGKDGRLEPNSDDRAGSAPA